jgi:hypothetical protein
MFGNGSGETGDQQPPDTGSLWGNMFGLGPLMKVISDPALVSHAHLMMAAIIEGAQASQRTEAKLNRLLKALGHEIEGIDAARPDQPPAFVTALLGANGAAGNRGFAPASLAPDDGSRDASPHDGTGVRDPRNGVAHDEPAGATGRLTPVPSKGGLSDA